MVRNTRPYCEACSTKHHQQSPLFALLFGLLVPGLGQIYNGDYFKGLLIFFTGWLIIPWIYGIVDAIMVAQAIAEGRRPMEGVPPGYIILALKIGVVGLSCLYLGFVWAVLSILGASLQR